MVYQPLKSFTQPFIFASGQTHRVLCEPGAPPQGRDPRLQGPHPRLWMEVRVRCVMRLTFSDLMWLYFSIVRMFTILYEESEALIRLQVGFPISINGFSLTYYYY